MNLSADERLVGAYFLMEHKYYEQAEQEAKGAAAMPVPLDEARLQRDVRVSIILGLLYGAQNKDEPAAEALAQAVTIAPRANLGLWRTEADLWAEVYWRRARAADKKGDAPAAAKHVESLRQYTPAASDTAIEIVNWLKASGRVKDGKDLFERVYAASREQIEATGGSDPTAMNDLAWLCARCDERLNEAVELANKAVAAKPENAAYLDTAAEANFKLGKRDEAIKLESKALALRPEDEFMHKQVERFKGEKK